MIFLLDYSKNIINQETIQLLLELADEVGLKVLLLIILMEQSLIKPKTEPCFILHCVQVKQ
jgi:hypothetical protein